MDACDGHDHHQKNAQTASELPKRLLHVGYPDAPNILSIVEVDELLPAAIIKSKSKLQHKFLSLSDALAPGCPSGEPSLRSPFASRGFRKRLGPYVTLSHRWGGPYQEYLTNKANIKHRQELLSYDALPRTWQDAVTVTRRLGFEYIWIDSLCIVKDDPQETHDEMKKMEDIYSGAACTIAATVAPTCDHGFLDRYTDDGFTGRRSSTTRTFNTEVKLTELNTRGWIYQERALSRRIIHFGEHHTYWECGHWLVSEFIPRRDEGETVYVT